MLVKGGPATLQLSKSRQRYGLSAHLACLYPFNGWISICPAPAQKLAAKSTDKKRAPVLMQRGNTQVELISQQESFVGTYY